MKPLLAAACIFTVTAGALAPLTVRADDVSDSLQNALDAYTQGDLQYALEELEFARQLMLAQKTDALGAFLPAAPEGYTRTLNTEMNAGLAMMGGGAGAEADYARDGDSFTVTLMADNPMISAFGAMIGNAAAMGARLERVGREKFMIQDTTVQGLIDNRILVKAEGGDPAMTLELLKTIDFRALADFGK